MMIERQESMQAGHSPDNFPPCRVSFVVTSRNDDHGGHMLRRLSLFVEGLVQLANKYGLAGELIIVEWNPPSGARLHEALRLRVKSDTFLIRVISVPGELHHRFRNSDVIPLFQYIAKNVGILRARGEFIVATNPDLLFSEALIEFLAAGTLDPGALYRIDRHDVSADVPEGVGVGEQLAWCAKHILRVHEKFGTFRWTHFRYLRFILRQSRILVRFVRGIFKSIRFVRWCGSFLLGDRLRQPMPPAIHTNACGDFTLLARRQWHKLRGYPEIPIWSMHIDSLLCYLAVAAGLTEQVLRPPAQIFHLEHMSSWVVMSPEDRLRTFAVKPWIDWHLVHEVWQDMFLKKRPLCLNAEDWGLGHMQLPEIVIHGDGRHETRTAAAAMQPVPHVGGSTV